MARDSKGQFKKATPLEGHAQFLSSSLRCCPSEECFILTGRAVLRDITAPTRGEYRRVKWIGK